MNQIIIEQKHRRIIQAIIHNLLHSPAFKPFLQEGIPLPHLLLRVGHVYHQPDKLVDLFKLYLEKNILLTSFVPGLEAPVLTLLLS